MVQNLYLFFTILCNRLKDQKDLISCKNASTIIEIDGGVTDKNARQQVEAGANVLVAGNFVFKAENPTQTIADLKKETNFQKISKKMPFLKF